MVPPGSCRICVASGGRRNRWVRSFAFRNWALLISIFNKQIFTHKIGTMGSWQRWNRSCRRCQHNLSLATDHLKVALVRWGWKVVYFRLWARGVAVATFQGSGTGGHWGGAWRRPGRQQAHRCPGPSSCLPCQIKSGLLFSPFSPNTHVNLPRPFHFSVSSLFSSPFFSLAFDQGLDLLVEWQRQEVLWGTGGAEAGGPSAEARADHSALCFPGPASSMAWPGPADTEPGFQPWLSSWSICQTVPVTTAQAHWSQRGEGRLQIEVLPGYSPGHNGIIYSSTNHKGDLLCVLWLDHDLWPHPFCPVGSQDFTSLTSCPVLSTDLKSH